MEYCKGASRLRAFVPGTGARPLGWAYPEQLGLSSTACGLVLGDFIRPCTNRVTLLHRIASVAPLSKLQTNSVPYTLGATWSTRSNDFEYTTKLYAGLITPLPTSDSGNAAVWDSKKINPRPQSCLCLTWSGYPSNDDDDNYIVNSANISYFLLTCQHIYNDWFFVGF